MTNQEAIETIEANYPPENYSMLREALDMAIARLKEQDNCENCAIAVEDRQPVVRCKDCKHFSPERIYMCRIHGSMFQPKNKNWFCADGERR